MMKMKFESLIIHEDEQYLIVNKPPFVSTLEDRMDPTNMLSAAKAYNEDVQVCHRLDKETSGILVFSKNADAYRNLAIQFEKREVEKVYHAISHGIHDYDGLKVDVSLSISGKGIVRVDREGKVAETRIKTGEVFKHHTLFYCKPITGRTHQIRVHLAYIQASIVNDTMYGGKDIFLSDIKKKFNLKKDQEEQPLIKRVALHSRSIQFTDLNGKTINADAAYPKDFEVLVKQLRKNA